MKRTSRTLPEIKLVGISVKTSYQQELDKIKGNIFPCILKWSQVSRPKTVKSNFKTLLNRVPMGVAP